jgi:maleate isomerase
MPLPRIGVLVPSTNTTVEADFQRVLSGCATVHAERLFIPDGTMTAEFLDEMNRDLDSKVRSLHSARVDVMVYACTSGSFYKGPAWDDAVINTIERIAGIPAITTSQAVKLALDTVNAKTLSVITPYPEWTNHKLLDYYSASGFDIVSIAGDVRAAEHGHRCINDQEPAEIADFARDHIAPEADALFCSCTAWRTFEVSAALEKECARPVITSNQATIWQALTLANVLETLPDHALQQFGMLAHARPTH